MRTSPWGSEYLSACSVVTLWTILPTVHVYTQCIHAIPMLTCVPCEILRKMLIVGGGLAIASVVGGVLVSMLKGKKKDR